MLLGFYHSNVIHDLTHAMQHLRFVSIGRKEKVCSGMEKQSETKESLSSENIIIRVRGPWGVSRIRCHRLDSLADLKRSVSARVNGLPRSSASILLFRDEHFSVEVAGEESATIRSINLKHGEILYAKPKTLQTNSLPKEDVSKQESSATIENKVKKTRGQQLVKITIGFAYNSG